MKKILHFFPDNAGVRFLKPIYQSLRERYDTDTYRSFRDVKVFLKVLKERLNKSDVVIITAHGDSDCILLKVRERFETGIGLEQTWLFRHDFVFAISCFAAREFGQSVVKNGAQAYLGFNDSIENDFVLGDSKNEKYKMILERIFKLLYNQCISHSIEKFIAHCKTAKELRLYMELYFKKKVGELIEMSIDEIKINFGVSIDLEEAREIKRLIKLEFISKFDSLNSKLVLLGNENYICWYNIENLEPSSLLEVLDKIESYGNNYLYYKRFIEVLAYTTLNIYDCKHAFKDLEEELKEKGLTDFEPYHFLKAKLAS